MSDGSARVETEPQPPVATKMTTVQKLLLCIPLLVAVIAAGVLWLNNTQTTGNADEDKIIEEITPLANSSVLQQSPVSIDLQSGWDASLTVNGRPIPDDQLTKVPAQGKVTFQPGPGKEFEFLQAAQNCVIATYWPLSNPEQKFRKTWCFKAT